ncbi:MAG TPA: HEAT repeat domain-containing protein [Candidatus Kapabacteria bacterium]|nr:HEAT repeat domain-containing protein [Candidatus Kapabacteria bacterium]
MYQEFAIIATILITVWFIIQSVMQRRRSVEFQRHAELLRIARSLARTPMAAAQEDLSYLERIRVAIREHPQGPLRYEGFPLISTSQPGTYYFPGVREARFEEARAAQSDADMLCAAVLAVRKGWIDDWRVLEQNVRNISAPYHFRTALASLPLNQITDRVVDLFAAMACHSSDLNAVKWGILISGLRLDPHQEPWIPELARHSEFTTYVCIVLQHARSVYPHATSDLLRLIPVTEGWGFFQVLNAVARDPGLAADPAISRELFVHGVANGRSAAGDVARTLVQACDIRARLKDAENDPVLARALFALISALAGEGEANEQLLLQLDDGESLVMAYLRLARASEGSIELITAMHTLGGLLDKAPPSWSRREELFEQAGRVFMTRLTRKVLSDAIRNDHFRFAALQIAIEMEMSELMPAIMLDFHTRPHPVNVNAIGMLGSDEHLEELYALLLMGESQSMAVQESESEAGSDGHHDLEEIARAVALHHIGKLNRPGVLETIKRHARHHTVMMRKAALTSLTHVQRWTLDAECKELVRAGLNDADQHVRSAAQAAAQYHTMHASLNRPGSGTIPLTPGAWN